MAVKRFILLSLLLIAITGWAQTGSMLDIYLYDSDNKPVRGAEIRIEPGGYAGESDFNGGFHLSSLALGQYHLSISSRDKAPFDSTIQILSSSQIRIEICLKPISIKLHEYTIISDQQNRAKQYSRDQIEASGASTLQDFLSSEAGLDVQSDGAAGGQSTSRIGGSNANQVLVLMDGRRIQSSANGEADLSSIPMQWIESIDIRRGAQPQLGGEAIGGIIDIQTRQPSTSEEINGSLEIAQTQESTTFYRSGQIGSLPSFFSYTRTQGQGDYTYRITEDDGNEEFTDNLGSTLRRKNNDVLRDQLFAKVVYQLNDLSTFTISGASDRSDRGMPGYLAPRLTPLARQTSGAHSLNIEHEWLWQSFMLKTRGSLSRSYRHFEDTDPYSLVNEAREADSQSEFEFECNRTFSSRSLMAGGGIGSEEFKSEQLTNGQARRNHANIWANAEQTLLGRKSGENLQAHVGMRAERFGDADFIGLPRLELQGFTHRLINTYVSTAWGKSYRAPSFYSLFWQEDQVARGNPDLLPELSMEWTGTLAMSLHSLRSPVLRAGASSQEIANLIVWQKTFDGHWKPFNLKSAKANTLDLELEQSLLANHIRLAAATTWTEARDATDDRNTDGKYLTFRPARTHRINLGIRLTWLQANASYRWVSARPVLATNSKWLSEYDIVDVDLSGVVPIKNFEFRPGIRLSNVFDESYRIIRHAPMPMRQITGTLQISYHPSTSR